MGKHSPFCAAVGDTRAVQISSLGTLISVKREGKGFYAIQECFTVYLTFTSAFVGRPRGPKGPDERSVVVDCVLALESAIRGFADRGTEVVVNPALGTNFDSLPEACEFYNLYSWEVGFGIRYGKSRQNVNGTKCMQEMVCGCAVSFCILFFPGLND